MFDLIGEFFQTVELHGLHSTEVPMSNEPFFSVMQIINADNKKRQMVMEYLNKQQFEIIIPE